MSNWHTVALKVQNVDLYKKVYRHLSTNAKRAWKITLVAKEFGFHVSAHKTPKQIIKRLRLYKNQDANYGFLVVKSKRCTDAALLKLFFSNNVVDASNIPVSSDKFWASWRKRNFKFNINSLYGTIMQHSDPFTEYEKILYYKAVSDLKLSPSKHKALVKRFRKRGHLLSFYSTSTPISKKNHRKIIDARIKRNSG